MVKKIDATKKVVSRSGSFEGWNIKKFVAGRKKLLVALVGYFAGEIVLHHPVYAGMVAASAEMIYSVIEYCIKEYEQ